jgi:glycerol-3-phosphate dehydrogenase
MRRDPAQLAAARYDLVVVGGGIHGLFAAYDAATRGLSVLLVERDDFGGGLSFNHQRTIHGGLRDLAAGRIGKARRQMAERRAWARISPHLIRPLPFLIGTYRFTKRSRWMLRAGFAAYDFLGRSRNVGVPSELHLPKARLESAATTRRLFPGVEVAGLTGGAVWYDYQVTHPDRLNWTVALAAMAAGACLVNYVDAVGILREGGRAAGIRAKDRLSGQDYDVSSTATLLSAGSGLAPLLAAAGVEKPAPPLLRAMNVLLDRPARDIAVAAADGGGRMLTLVPWRGYALVGTHQSREPVAAGESVPPGAALDEMLATVNKVFPPLRAERRHIRLVHHGLAPAVVANGRADLQMEPAIVQHQDAPGLFSLVGVKLTTARLAAEHAVDAVCAGLGRRGKRCRTAIAPLPHAGIADVEGRLAETLRATGTVLDRDVTTHLTAWYGTEASALIESCVATSRLDRLSPDVPVLAGEIAYATEHMGAIRLADAVLRRTPLGSAGHPGRPALERAAAVMGDLLGWTPLQREEEIASVEARYAWGQTGVRPGSDQGR